MKKKVVRVLSIIGSGYRFRDRLSLLLYFISWPLRRTFFKGIDLISKVVIKNKDGFFYCGNYFSAVECVNPLFEKELRYIFKNINSGIFIDIGSNVGKYTVMVGKRIKEKVISIEPETNNLIMLKESVKINNLNNVYLVGSACSSKNGKKLLFIGDGVGRHSFYRDKLIDSTGTLEVDTKKLDTIVFKILKNDEIRNISFIKIDVEGAELDVIRGAVNTLKMSHPKVLIEIWDKKRLQKVNEILSKLKYVYKKVNEENYLFE